MARGREGEKERERERKRDGGQKSESKEAHPRAFARNRSLVRGYDERETVNERERDEGRSISTGTEIDRPRELTRRN